MILSLEQIGVMLDELDMDQPQLNRTAAVRYARAVEDAIICAMSKTDHALDRRKQMFTVTILVNGQPILTRSARNVFTDEFGVCTYDVDDGNKVYHRPKGGAVVLAKKLLDLVKEP